MIVALKTPFAAGAMPEERLQTRAMLTRVAGLGDTCSEPVHALEPHFPWDVDLLTLRRDCYAATNDPLLAAAERDLQKYIDLEPQPFVVGRPLTAH